MAEEFMFEYGGVGFTSVHLGIIGALFVLFLFTFIKWRMSLRKASLVQNTVDELDHEKAEMYSKNKTLEDDNRYLKQKLEDIEAKYSGKFKELDEKEKRAEKDSKELDDKLKKIRAMEETIEMHRTKIGVLEVEKRDIQARLDNLSRVQEKELSSEKEKLEAIKVEIKEKTKEAITTLQKENEELHQKVDKLKDRLSLWESVKDL